MQSNKFPKLILQTRIKTIFLFFIFFLSCPLAMPQESPWQLALKKRDISVYTRPVEGSSFDEFKGIKKINAPLEVIAEVIFDVNSYTKWMSDCSRSDIIEQVSDMENVAYVSQKLPWPVRDRDVITKSKVYDNLDNKELLISFSSVERDDVPPKKGFIRMASMVGHWKLTYIDNDNTLVEYQIKADPSGSIPPMIANMTSKKIPYETLLGLTKMVKEQKYIDIAKRSIFRQRINDLLSE